MIVNEAYIDLLFRALSEQLSDEVVCRRLDMHQALTEGKSFPNIFSIAACEEILRQANIEYKSYLLPLGKTVEEILELNGEGLFSYLNWMNPIRSPHTMAGRDRLENLRFCMDRVLTREVPGDLIETGVWKGGMTVLMRGILKAYDCTNRTVWVADSFEGLPKPDPATHLKDALFWYVLYPLNHLQIPIEYTEGLFSRYGLLDDQVKFLKGWFHSSLPASGIEKLAIARLDGDLYESTHDALSYLYPRLSSGGYLIVDDYGVPCGCQQAVDEFRTANSIDEPMSSVSEPVAVFWRKP